MTLQVGDRVEMLVNDGFGQKGWLGTVVDPDYHGDGNVARVSWDNSKNYLHQKRDLQIIADVNNPNYLFRRRKLL